MADTLITGTTIIEDKRSETGKVWSCAGVNFKSQSLASTGLYYVTPGGVDNGKLHITSQDGENDTCAPVNLPHGAVVTGAIVYGSDTAETWILRRIKLSDQSDDTLATGTIGTESTTITSEEIDNFTYAYFLTAGTGNSDEIYGARITYK